MAGWALHPSTSVTGPQELVTQGFAILLEYLVSPDSSPTVRAGRAGVGRQLLGAWPGLGLVEIEGGASGSRERAQSSQEFSLRDGD